MKKPVFSLFSFVAMAICSTLSINAQNTTFNCYLPDQGGSIREHNVDFISLDLDVKFAPEDGLVSGIARYAFTALEPTVDSVFLDGPGIRVQEISLDNNATKFKMDSAGITVYFNPPLIREAVHNMAIIYDANPKKGIYFNGWNVASTDNPNDPTIIRKQIWTQGQGVDNRFWIPSYDGVNDKLLTMMHITFDSTYTVVSNGNLKNVSANADGTKTWRYAMPHPHALYLVMLAIGKYDVMEFTSKNGITTRQYYYPGTKEYAENTYRYTAELMDWMQQATGLKYPWSTYANVPVQEFLYGAMENTTATIFSDFFYQRPASNPDKQYIEINAHELTHQWFGDYVTAWSGSSHWLQESFATYFSKHFAQHINGDDYYDWKRREEMLTALDADSRDNIPIAHSEAGSQRVYQKGSFVIDMLRYVVGDQAFNVAIQEFLERYPYANVSTQDFQMQFMRSLGMNMDWFFDEWLYRAGFPVYTVKYDTTENATVVHVSQTQQTNETVHLFNMPIHIQIHYMDGSFDDQLVVIKNAAQDITIQNPEHKQVLFVLFDPNHMVLSKVVFDKSFNELTYQAFNAPNMIDRYEAISAMTETPIEVKRVTLLALLKKEKFNNIRIEIIRQLSSDNDKATVAALKNAIYDTDPLVRRSVVVNWNKDNDKLRKDIETLLKDDNYVNIELALRKLCDYYPKQTSEYLQKTAGQFGATNNIRVAWLELQNKDNNNGTMSELIKFTSPQYEFRTRVAAFNAISNRNYCDPELVANLFNALVSTNHRLSSPARNLLMAYKSNPEYATMIKAYYNSRLWTEWEDTRIGKVKE
ncbi:MAG TPA: M1 family metallopeptidase [Chitinophagales bacterium]|nr:M1 family metallopeptidase [Chitinophagales bacterium]HNJ87958.1 M1 family metallopeptidase [Chitinophagales bacterium]